MLQSHQNFATKYLNLKLIDCAQNIDLLLETKDKLNKNIRHYWSDVQMANRSNIIFNHKNAYQISTSGSMANPFRYFVTKKLFYKMEIIHHYRQILMEYNLLDQPLKILRVSRIKDTRNCKKIAWKNCNFFYKCLNPSWNNYFFSHGSDQAVCHHFQYHPRQTHEFCNFLLSVFEKQNFDIFLTAFSFVSMFLNVIQKPVKICHLLSNICEAPNQNHVKKLIENNQIDFFCDHMRCWDGGFGFYTCKHNVKHIYEPYIDSKTVDGKILSTDYFNFNSSFIDYWNNDTGTIEEKWLLCECKKWYRPFVFQSNRVSFNLKKISSIELHDEISKLDNTIQAVCYKNFVNIITVNELSQQEKNRLMSVIGQPIRFTCQNFIESGSHSKILRIVNRTHKDG